MIHRVERESSIAAQTRREWRGAIGERCVGRRLAVLLIPVLRLAVLFMAVLSVGVRSMAVLLLPALLYGCGGAAMPSRGAPSFEAPSFDATEQFAALTRGLVGSWSATPEAGRDLRVDYRVTSRGSALVETWAPATPGETVTMYHRDGGDLLLTHYCGQGNQATLRAVEARAERIVFRRVAVTNYAEDQSALSELTLELSGDDELVRTEVYSAADGSRETTVLRFARVATP